MQINKLFQFIFNLVGFRCEPECLVINEVCFDHEQDIPYTREKSRKTPSAIEWCRCEKFGVICINVEYLGCGEVEALGYFQLLDMRYNDTNAVIERVSTAVLKLYLILQKF